MIKSDSYGMKLDGELRRPQFSLWYSSYQFVTEYKWKVTALLVKVCKPAQDMLVHSTERRRVALGFL